MMRRFVVILGLGVLSISDLITYVRAIITAMTGNAFFPSPPIALDLATAAVNELDTVYQASQEENSGKDETAAVRAKRFTLITLIQFLAAYVQFTANNDHENGEQIIFSAFMGLKDNTGGRERFFRARNDSPSGTALLETARVPNAVYEWEYNESLTDESTWVPVPATGNAKTTIKGLTPVTRYRFRVRANTPNKIGDWQGPITLVVV